MENGNSDLWERKIYINKIMKLCSVNGCVNKHSAKGFCNLHYQRFIRNIPMEGNSKKDLLIRIIGKVVINESSGCWEWIGAISGGDRREKYKYGCMTINKKQKRVHRVLYEYLTGITIGNKLLCHKCDNTICVNPDHLFIGTHKDNMRDMIAKNRDYHPKGENNHSKLKEWQVLEIRRRYAHDESFDMITKDYPVVKSTIQNIIYRKKWRGI